MLSSSHLIEELAIALRVHLKSLTAFVPLNAILPVTYYHLRSILIFSSVLVLYSRKTSRHWQHAVPVPMFYLFNFRKVYRLIIITDSLHKSVAKISRSNSLSQKIKLLIYLFITVFRIRRNL